MFPSKKVPLNVLPERRFVFRFPQHYYGASYRFTQILEEGENRATVLMPEIQKNISIGWTFFTRYLSFEADTCPIQECGIAVDIDQPSGPTSAMTDHSNLVGSQTDYAIQKKNQRSIGKGDQKKLPPGDVDKNADNAVDNVHTDIRDRDKRLETEIEIKVTDSNESVCRTGDGR